MQYLKKEVSDEDDLLHSDKHENLLQLDTKILMGMVMHSPNNKFVMSLQYLKKEVRDEVDFLNADKHQSFLQVDFNSLGIKVSFKGILSLLMVKIKHSQITQSNRSTIFLQYLKKEVENRVHFLYADKHQSFYKLELSFLMEVARHVLCTQSRKLVTFMPNIQKKVSQMLLCSIVMQNIQIFMWIQSCSSLLVIYVKMEVSSAAYLCHGAIFQKHLMCFNR